MRRRARVLVVGEAPNRRDESLRILKLPEPLLREDLAGLCGLTLEGWRRTFDRVNLLDRWPGRLPGRKGSAFPIAQATTAAARLIPRLARYERVVLLGRRVAHTYRVDQPWLTWLPFGQSSSRLLAVAPHPSRVSRWWNDPSNVVQARAFWALLAIWASNPPETERPLERGFVDVGWTDREHQDG